MKVLVLGASGMAGHVVSTHLAEQGYDVDTLSSRNKLNDRTILIDATNINSLRTFLQNNIYDIVINCIGVLIKQSEDRKDLATCLNSYLPHFLEEFYKDTPTKLIQLSTDCVFSGKNAPYGEKSTYDGELFYDRSKALGEVINDKDLTFRMSIIGPDMQDSGTGLFNWFYAQTGKVNGYAKAIWSGVTTIELAKGIQSAIEQNITGLYHFVPNQNISKYDLLKLFAKIFKRDDITVVPTDVISLDKTLINNRKDFDYKVNNYEKMVDEMKTWINNHKGFYKHYDSKK